MPGQNYSSQEYKSAQEQAQALAQQSQAQKPV